MNEPRRPRRRRIASYNVIIPLRRHAEYTFAVLVLYQVLHILVYDIYSYMSYLFAGTVEDRHVTVALRQTRGTSYELSALHTAHAQSGGVVSGVVCIDYCTMEPCAWPLRMSLAPRQSADTRATLEPRFERV